MPILIILGPLSNADPYGSRASFLLEGFGHKWMSLSYLSDEVDENWRTGLEYTLITQGDTHIYLYSRNEAKDVGHISPRGNWGERLDHLNSIGLRPVMWLMADDSPSLVDFNEGISHNRYIAENYDSKIDHYVIGLEVDEYWTADQVKALIEDLRQYTEKPIGVHLTPSTPLEYVESADVLYLQTGFGLSQEQFREKVRATLSASSKPVIVSEYHLDSTSAEAKQLGDIACQLGAIGTGNGRNIQACGQREAKNKVPKFAGSAALVLGGVAALMGLNVVMKNDWAQIGHDPDKGLGFRYGTGGEAIITYRMQW